jgi:hypothetical protein
MMTVTLRTNPSYTAVAVASPVTDKLGLGAGTGAGKPGKVADDPYKDFSDYMKMTPMQRIRAAVLKELGVTEDDLKSMSPEQSRAVENKIEEMIKEAMKQEDKNKEYSAKPAGQLINTGRLINTVA